MVLFFALFGFLFLATQYLQFVLGYSPSAAGVRVLPYAGAMIVFAPLSSQLVARFGTKRVVDRRDAALRGRARRRRDRHDRTRATAGSAIALRAHGRRAWGSRAPRRPSRSWARCRPSAANIGSAVNDTTRELGGALGVAIVGSIMSSLYATQLSDALPDDVPAPVAAAARESLGAAVQAGSARVADAAREAFVHAMSRASIVVAVVAALGALIAWRYLPAHSPARGAGASRGRGRRPIQVEVTQTR